MEYKSAVDLVTDVDRASQALLIDTIRHHFPDDAIVAEEDRDPAPAGAPAGAPGRGWCWCIDPLDGTTNFVHALPHFAVSVAAFEDGVARLAAVYDPSRRELFHAARGHGAFLGDMPLSVSATSDLGRALLVTGFPYDRREHIDEYLEYFREFIRCARDVRRLGSASLDLCYVAAGRFDGFWECGLAPWDTAAGWLIVEEAGGTVSDFDGAPYSPWLPRILASNGAVHDAMKAVIAALPSRADAASVPGAPPAC